VDAGRHRGNDLADRVPGTEAVLDLVEGVVDGELGAEADGGGDAFFELEGALTGRMTSTNPSTVSERTARS
jgi:hypothetical protein